MIADLKPYAEYKESGLPWLGQAPRHWVTKRGKSYLATIDERSKTGKEELLTVSSARGVVPRSSANVTMFKAESYAGHKLCWPGDLVINSLWAWGGGLGVSQHHGIISTAYSVYRSRPSAEINPHFLHALVRSSAFQWELQVRSKGVWISRLQLTDTAFLDAPIPLPPPDEQAAIVRFLGWANGRLERAISSKRKVITLLNEQKQAVINRAVTRGLDSSVPLKPSGVHWLGDIPRHWEVRKVREIGAVVNGFPFDSRMFTSDHGHSLIRIRDLNKAETAVRYRGDFVETARVKSGDVLVGMDGDFNVGTWRGADDALLNQRMCCVRTSSPLLNELLLSALSRPLRQINEVTYATTVKHLAASQVERISIAVPPASEMEALVRFIRERRQDFEGTVARLEHEIQLLREYRTRLVADVVTGKLDVREAATRLPEEVPLGTVADAADLGEDLDSADEEAAV
jgi:type I restriction enzyme S subunit